MPFVIRMERQPKRNYLDRGPGAGRPHFVWFTLRSRFIRLQRTSFVSARHFRYFRSSIRTRCSRRCCSTTIGGYEGSTHSLVALIGEIRFAQFLVVALVSFLAALRQGSRGNAKISGFSVPTHHRERRSGAKIYALDLTRPASRPPRKIGTLPQASAVVGVLFGYTQ
jgi:hypothetical protein